MEPGISGVGSKDEGAHTAGPYSFLKGVLVTVAIYMASIPLILIPIIGLILSLTLVPYLASSLGTRKAMPRERTPISLTASAIWSLIETAVLIGFMSAVETPIGFVMERIGMSIIIILWTLNLIFGLLGALKPWMDPFKVR